MADQHGSPTRAAESPSAEHKAHGPASVACSVITCSDTRTPETDTSGQLIRTLLEQAGHRIHAYHVVKDEPSQVRTLIRQAGGNQAVDALIINGGTGVSQRDSTFEAVRVLLEKHIPGFGELFRSLSYKEIGSAAMLSRATAGLHQGKVIFSIPGSRGAVRLAMEDLILPELSHLVGELRK